jgi:hypothetical protein
MRVVLQTLRQMQRTSPSLRYAICGPGNIQFIYNTSYSGNNIQVNVSALLLEICRYMYARYTANLVPYITHTLQLTLCELWPRLYTKYLQLRIFRLQYSAIGICAAIGDIPTMGRALYRKHWAKYSAQPPAYAMWTVVPDIYNVFTAPHIQASIFNWRYLPWFWWYSDNSMCVMLQTWCQIPRTSSSLRYLNCGPGHIQCNNSSTYSGFTIHLNVSPPLLEIYRQFSVRYTANVVPNTAHILQITLCELWSRTYTM